MENIYIYLAGGMSGLTIEEQVKWRNNFKNIFKYNDIEIIRKPIIFSPPDYYSFSSTHDNVSEKEIMEFDLYNLRNSDIVVVNFNAPQSLGTAMEIAIAHEYRIPIIGLNEENHELHPLIIKFTIKIFNTFIELANYNTDYYFR